MRQSWDILRWGSPLMGCRAVTVPGSGTLVQCRHRPIYGAAQGLHWVLQTWVQAQGQLQGQLVSVVLESQASPMQQAEAAAVVQAWQVQVVSQKCEVWQKPAVWLTSEVVSVGLTLCSWRCHLMQQ